MLNAAFCIVFRPVSRELRSNKPLYRLDSPNRKKLTALLSPALRMGTLPTQKAELRALKYRIQLAWEPVAFSQPIGHSPINRAISPEATSETKEPYSAPKSGSRSDWAIDSAVDN